MGTTTRFHPLGLSVIRGAAQYGGFLLGRIHQTSLGFGGTSAHYTVQLRGCPAKVFQKGPAAIKAALQSCFMDDIEVQEINYSEKRGYSVKLRVDVSPRSALADKSEVSTNANN